MEEIYKLMKDTDEEDEQKVSPRVYKWSDE